MVNLLPEENPDEEGYLLHELQNASPPEDFETEQRERMPEAAFLRENIEEEIEIEENNQGIISRSNQVWTQPDRIRRTLNDNRETFGTDGIKIYHQSVKWTNQPLGDAVHDLYKDI